MRVLYIGKNINIVKSGADLINWRNIQVIQSSSTAIDFIEPICSTYISKIYFGISNRFIHQVNVQIQFYKYDYIFISQSLFGRLAKAIKKKYPKIRIISFFHNVERQYAKELIRVKGVKHILFYYASWLSERNCCKYSNHIISLNERDAMLLLTYYGKSTSIILPTTFEDRFQKEKVVLISDNNEIRYLFVGVGFYANIEAVKWFVKNVLPHIPGCLYVVGKDMDIYLRDLINERVKIYGYVDDLSSFYYSANFVVSPILSGGGMKTKTAEALMYGKTIIGTREAFEGYDIKQDTMYLCSSANEFIRTITTLILSDKFSTYNNDARDHFLEKYRIDTSKEIYNTWLINWI